ncbi:MAG: hypothetical protein V3R78_12395 [Thermodesulfobacteriota bacterium]
MKNTETFSQSNTQKEASSSPISQESLLEKIANLDGTLLLGKPEFKHLEEYLPERGIDEKHIEVLNRVIKDQDGFNFFRKKLKENKLKEFIKEETLLHSLPKEILEIIKGYKGREFVLQYYPATRDKTGNTEVGIDIFRKGSTDHCGHIYFYYRWDDKIKGYCIYFGWITTIIHQDAKRLGIAKQAIGLVGQLFPPGSIEMYPNTTDREVIAKGPKAEALVYKNLAGAGGFTEALNLDDSQIAHTLKINPFEHSRYAFKKIPITAK